MLRRVFERIQNILIVLLTLTMLLLAGFYIGALQFSDADFALRTAELPKGAVPVGSDAPHQPADYERGLLAVRAAAITIDGETVCAYGDTPAAQALFEFAMPGIHDCLGVGASLSFVSSEDYLDATEGDSLCLQFASALPYQILYAMTGEVTAAAGFSDAVRADTLLLTFTETGETALYLTDGREVLMAVCETDLKKAELSALTEDESLAPGVLLYGRIVVCDRAQTLPSVRFSTGRPFTGEEYNDLFYLFAYNPDKHRALWESGETEFSIVEPHGTLEVTDTAIRYEASIDGGISLSAFTDTAKDALDIGLYDVLSAAIRFAENMREIAPACFGGDAHPYLRSFYREGDGYTVTFGLTVGGVEITGDALPYLAKLTVRGDAIRSVEIRRICAEKSTRSITLFPAAWEYAYAAKDKVPASFRLCYLPAALDAQETDADWYCTYTD